MFRGANGPFARPGSRLKRASYGPVRCGARLDNPASVAPRVTVVPPVRGVSRPGRSGDGRPTPAPPPTQGDGPGETGHRKAWWPVAVSFSRTPGIGDTPRRGPETRSPSGRRPYPSGRRITGKPKSAALRRTGHTLPDFGPTRPTRVIRRSTRVTGGSTRVIRGSTRCGGPSHAVSTPRSRVSAAQSRVSTLRARGWWGQPPAKGGRTSSSAPSRRGRVRSRTAMPSSR